MKKKKKKGIFGARPIEKKGNRTLETWGEKRIGKEDKGNGEKNSASQSEKSGGEKRNQKACLKPLKKQPKEKARNLKTPRCCN